MTGRSRYATKVPVPIHEFHNPKSRGLVLDIGEKGLRVSGIRARVDELKTFVIPADELVMIDPLVFDASCRWVIENEGGVVSAGFAVTRVTNGNFAELKLLLRSMIRDYEKLPELRPMELDGEITQTVDLSSLFSQDVTSSGSFDFGGLTRSWFGRLIQALPIPALLLDEWLNIILANQSWARVSSDFEQLQGRTFASLFANPSFGERATDVAQEVYSTRKPESTEAVLSIENNKMWGRMHLRSVRMGASRTVLVLVEDLTLEKQQLVLKHRHEREILKERNALEVRVKERTAELAAINEQLKAEIVERKRAEQEKELLIAELQSALTRVKRLSGLIPICASCKKIRDDQGYWKQIEAYIREHSEADFSHGICPDCARRLYPELFDDE